MAKAIEAAYQSFSDNVIMVDSNNVERWSWFHFETSSRVFEMHLIKSKKWEKKQLMEWANRRAALKVILTHQFEN
jgi:hypothetical protein